MSHFFGLRPTQERAFLPDGHVHTLGTPRIGTTDIASMPIMERCTS